MTFTPADDVSVAAFLLIVAFVPAAVIAGTYAARLRLGEPAPSAALRTAAALLAWLVLSSLPVASGVLASRPMPAIPLYFLVVNGAALGFGLSSSGRKLALGLPLWALVGFQAFRLPLELVLHSWAAQGTIPRTMTWTGQNLDVVTGVVALVAAPWATRSRTVAWAFNGLGIVLLLNVARVAALSSPLPFAWPVEPPLQLALHLPYAWIVPICVAGALAGHVVLTRALLLKKGPNS